MPMRCTMEKRTLTVYLSGEIDHHAARALMRSLEEEIACSFPRALVLDFSGVTFMDSSGIALMLRTLHRMQEIGGSMQAVEVPKQVQRVLVAARLQRMIPIMGQTAGEKHKKPERV